MSFLDPYERNRGISLVGLLRLLLLALLVALAGLAWWLLG